MLLLALLACTPPDDTDKPARDDTAADTDTDDTGTDDTDTDDTDTDDTDTDDTDTAGDTDTDTAPPPVDADADGYTADVDCDDANAAVNPGVASDPCNGIDDDCDGTYEEDSAGPAAWHGGVAYTSLAEALARTEAGDTVGLCPGTYTGTWSVAEPVILEGWARDPARTILDGNGAEPVLGVSDIVDRPDAVGFAYLTVRNGVADRGGALYAYAANVRVTNSVLENNTGRVGGAIAAISSESVNVTDSTLQDNVATDAGGAIYVEGSRLDTVTLTTTGSTYARNAAAEEGGAIGATFYGYGNVNPQSSVFDENTAGTSGGAVAIAIVKNLFFNSGSSTFTGNVAGDVAGAVWVYSDLYAELNTGSASFTDNSAAAGAGAVYVEAPTAVLNASGTWHRNVAADGSCAGVGGYGEIEGDWGTGADENLGCDVSLSVCEQVRTDLGAGTDVQCRPDGSWTE